MLELNVYSELSCLGAPPSKIFCQLNECYNVSVKKKNYLYQACRVIFVITNFLMIFACLLNVHIWHYSDLIDHNGSRGAIAGYWASDLWIKNSLTVLKKLLQFIVSVTPAFLVCSLPLCSCHWHRPWKWGCSEEAHGWEKGWAAKQSQTGWVWVLKIWILKTSQLKLGAVWLQGSCSACLQPKFH